MFFSNGSYSQSTNIDSVRAVLQKINKVFDSAQYLAFDVNINLNTDTVFGRSETDHQLAQYVLNGKNIFYNVGGIDFMQNDSLSITAYTTENVLFISKQSIQNNSELFPIKAFEDSMLNAFFNYYVISITATNEGKRLSFISDSTEIPYKKIVIEYEEDHFFPTKMEFSFMALPETSQEDDSSITILNAMPAQLIQKTISMGFSNYRPVADLKLFNEDNYFYFNPIRKEFEAVGKYLGYRVIASNMESTAVGHNDIEVPAPVESVIAN